MSGNHWLNLKIVLNFFTQEETIGQECLTSYWISCLLCITTFTHLIGFLHYPFTDKCVFIVIGRAIRHINDYAAILLVDTRYASDSSKRSFAHPVTKLPQWIKDRFVSTSNNYGEIHRLLHQFFKLKKTCCQ